MRWGVFECQEDVHVAPWMEGYVRAPHTLSVLCVCEPDVAFEKNYRKPLVTHRCINWN